VEKKQVDEEVRSLRASHGINVESSLLAEYKRIKGFAKALIDMRLKVSGE
jgi:hypothetical protein